MCGIIGFNWADEALAEELASCMDHRGPDADGAYSDEQCSLGHRRLSIIGLSETGNQPLWTAEEDIGIVFNGEIFNYKSIRNDLKEQGYEFKSETDTEVLLLGYKEWGDDVLDRVNGQYAFCIYDKPGRELFLARDRAGINPLYYYWDGEQFIFTSEFKGILKSGVEKSVSESALDYYLMYGYTPPEQTIIEDAYKLRPGTYLRFDLDGNMVEEQTTYWEASFNTTITTKEKAVKAIRSELDRAVQRRMIADVPVGAFLSGGLDSSAVVAHMTQHTDDLNTYSVSFDKQDYDESQYAKKVADQFNTNHTTVEFDANDLEELLPRLPHHYDEPFGDHSLLPMFLVAQVASEDVTVALSGDGSDEIFGGYEKYKLFEYVTYQEHAKPAFKAISKFSDYLPRKLQRYALYANLEQYQQYANINSYQYIEDLTEDDLAVYEAYKPYFNQDHWLSNAINADFNLYLPDDILTKVDRACLANSLEPRPPFLDKNMVDLAGKIDPRLKRSGGEGKAILKEAMEGILPDEIIYREKEGFGSPIKHYFRDELKDFVKARTVDYDEHDHFDHLDIEGLYEAHVDKEEDYSRMLWTIMMFNMWWETWMNH